MQHFMRVLNNQNGCPTISTELEEHNGISRLNLDNLDKREEINGALIILNANVYLSLALEITASKRTMVWHMTEW